VEPIQLAAVLAVVVLVASMVSVELGITAALIELTLGVVAGNLFDLHSQEWLDFIASFASIVLTFLAGMEVDPDYMRDRARATVGIGIASFIGPFVAASSVAYLLLDWAGKAALIAGTALSTTSLAVVYAVLVERNLTDTRIGKLLMNATFVTDLCTALALSIIFIKGGLNVSLGAVLANLGLLGALLAAKLLPKVAFIYPLARRAAPRHATFATLLMSTGLTFGTISSLYGLNAGIIDRTQFSLLVTVVVLSAVVPTAIAERWFLPDPAREAHEERPHAPYPSEEYV